MKWKGKTVNDTNEILSIDGAIQLAKQVLTRDRTDTLTAKNLAQFIVQMCVQGEETEYEWRVTWTTLYSHPGKRTPAFILFSTEQEADDCIAGKMECSPQMGRDSKDVRKQYRTKAGLWTNVPMKNGKNDTFMSDLKRVLFERPLTSQEIEAHQEAGENFHAPTSAVCWLHEYLNRCGICGAQIIPVEGGWIAITDEDADHMMATSKGRSSNGNGNVAG